MSLLGLIFISVLQFEGKAVFLFRCLSGFYEDNNYESAIFRLLKVCRLMIRRCEEQGSDDQIVSLLSVFSLLSLNSTYVTEY